MQMTRGTLKNSEFVNHWRIIVFIIIHDILNVLLYPKSFTFKSLLTSQEVYTNVVGFALHLIRENKHTM